MYGWRRCPYCHKDLQCIPIEDIEKWRNEGRNEVVEKAESLSFLKSPPEDSGDVTRKPSLLRQIINTLNFWRK